MAFEMMGEKWEGRLEYTEIIVEKEYPIGYITINRPEKRNAISLRKGATIPQLLQAFDDMRVDPEIRVFVLKGAGDNFCAGYDQSVMDEGVLSPGGKWPDALGWMEGVEQEPWTRYARGMSGDYSMPEGQSLRRRDYFWDYLWNNPKPVIAQVHSFCLGAGLQMANQCDIVFATPDAIFAYPPIRDGASVVLGILPPWLLGRRRAMEMALTGRCITAEEAYTCGLITRVVPADEIDEAVREEAMMIATVPPATNMFSKRAINNYYEGLGIEQAQNFGSALVMMTENSWVPGHYFDYFKLVREKGYTEGRKIHRAQFNYNDPVLNREVERLKAKKGKMQA
jgi:enoyl-CoA hydratase/carnithine racemase